MSAPAATGDAARWTAGVDWLTWVWEDDDHLLRSGVVTDQLLERHATPLDKKQDFKLLRWRGWKIGAVRVGLSDRSSLVQLSGKAAAESWTLLASCGGRPTRLDVQTTVQLSRPQPLYGLRFLRVSRRKTRRHPSQRPKRGLWRASDGAFLGTVGARTNARYLRVYDKGVESRLAPPGVLWRLEVEAKGRLAPALFADLQRATEVELWCLNSCAEQWRLSGYSWGFSESSRGSMGVTVPTAPPPDAERMATWLATTVRPAMCRLRKVYSRDQLLHLIGLADDHTGTPLQNPDR